MPLSHRLLFQESWPLFRPESNSCLNGGCFHSLGWGCFFPGQGKEGPGPWHPWAERLCLVQEQGQPRVFSEGVSDTGVGWGEFLVTCPLMHSSGHPGGRILVLHLSKAPLVLSFHLICYINFLWTKKRQWGFICVCFVGILKKFLVHLFLLLALSNEEIHSHFP